MITEAKGYSSHTEYAGAAGFFGSLGCPVAGARLRSIGAVARWVGIGVVGFVVLVVTGVMLYALPATLSLPRGRGWKSSPPGRRRSASRLPALQAGPW